MSTVNYFKGNSYKLFETYGIGFDLRGRIFIFSIEDFDLIKQYTWNVNPKHGYVICSSKNIRMHRLIMGNPTCKVDHINLCRHDNRRINLRLATQKENNRNSRLRRNNTSGYTGVYFNNSINKWMAFITVNYKKITLGIFNNKTDAICARIKAEEKYYGLFAPSISNENAQQNQLNLNEKCSLIVEGGNPSGYVGINWNKTSEKWFVFDNTKYLTSFKELDDAITFKKKYEKDKENTYESKTSNSSLS